MSKLLSVVSLVGCAVGLAACGSPGKPSGTGGTADLALELARCMRAHGVPNFPDPRPGRGLKLTAQINPSSPSFQAAQQACKRYLPSFPEPGAMTASQREKAFAFAKCMRAHGESDFPDPTIGSVSPATTGRVLALRGMFFAVSANFDPRAPAFRQAASACGLKPPQG